MDHLSLRERSAAQQPGEGGHGVARATQTPQVTGRRGCFTGAGLATIALAVPLTATLSQREREPDHPRANRRLSTVGSLPTSGSAYSRKLSWMSLLSTMNLRSSVRVLAATSPSSIL
jgi:hypothetical protein